MIEQNDFAGHHDLSAELDRRDQHHDRNECKQD